MEVKEINRYYRLTARSRVDKAVNSLLGLVEGISIDGQINAREITLLRIWLEDHEELSKRHPFSELVPAVARALQDSVIDKEEREDLVWLCKKLRDDAFYDMVTADLQRLHGVVGGIASDGHISEAELRGLSEWLEAHEHLKTCWPYDEVASITTQVLADSKIDPAEHAMLLDFFREFLAVMDERTIVNPPVRLSDDVPIAGLCAVMPDIAFQGSVFCFTGASSRHTKSELSRFVSDKGGSTVENVSAKLNFLVIGADGNPCWAYACYGRKVEKAVELRKKGARLLIVHENDFHDALLDH
ncbi:BRCT domain-containing protein [Variovorax sp. VNK109]|uniref:BRCT domain-containing protein n=1 Tax=Variovorax sp. VNK109 TaxID=3400919 RepID=UPI003C009F66